MSSQFTSSYSRSADGGRALCTPPALVVELVARSRHCYLPGVVVAFWCLHTGYGTGFLAGVLRVEGRRDRRRIPRLEPQD